MALTQTDLNNLDAAIASSELEVEIGGRRVRYRSIDQLLTARRHVAEVVSAQTAQQRLTYRPTFVTQRGG